MTGNEAGWFGNDNFLENLQFLFDLRQCHECCFSSGDELVPTMADWDEPASRCGRKIQPPKVFFYPEDQVGGRGRGEGRS